MNHRIPKQLGLAKKLLIAAVGTALLAVLIVASTQFRDEFAGKLEPGCNGSTPWRQQNEPRCAQRILADHSYWLPRSMAGQSQLQRSATHA